MDKLDKLDKSNNDVCQNIFRRIPLLTYDIERLYNLLSGRYNPVICYVIKDVIVFRAEHIIIKTYRGYKGKCNFVAEIGRATCTSSNVSIISKFLRSREKYTSFWKLYDLLIQVRDLHLSLWENDDHWEHHIICRDHIVIIESNNQQFIIKGPNFEARTADMSKIFTIINKYTS